ncbi:class D sortase [Candidatus Nanosynbacter sp. BB002]|jgi:sortase family protein|uniref:sortase n=1 Tax=Candidatus Nanosynbacter sp. BB002 TaxID=3393757 RepID=UPI0030CB5F75
MNPGSPRPFQPPARDQSSTRNAAADVIRGQINSIYTGNSSDAAPHTTPAPASTTPQEPALQPQPQPQAATPVAKPAPQTEPQGHRLNTTPPTDTTTATTSQPTQLANSTPQATPDQWQQYHSAWQKYYQMYYERYYANHLNAQQSPSQRPQTSTPEAADTLSPQQQAIRDLRSKIRNTVNDSAKKVRNSRHFIPALAGTMVMLAFVFLQYNRVILGTVAAYTSPGNIEPQNIIVDPSIDTKVSAEPKIIIPKINVDAPVVYGAAPDVQSQRKAMEKGVAHFAVSGASALPGQAGNVVLAGHSSNDAFAAGGYKFIFAQNEKLQKDDVIYLNYEGKRYTYKITGSEVVKPNEVTKIQTGTQKPMLTLVSCVPVGTADKRLLVYADQISPDPNTASAAAENNATGQIPGNPSPTVLERIFGAR